WCLVFGVWCLVFGVSALRMNSAARSAKEDLRRSVRDALKAMSPEERLKTSVEATKLLVAQRRWTEAQSVLFYAPMERELDIWPLLKTALESGKHACLPRFDPTTRRYVACQIKDPKTDLESGQFRIREPGGWCASMPLIKLDFILVPGVAFDLRGRRLGRGKGHYDRLLAATRGTTCGVAFDEQIVREVPVEPHDVLLNCILTPTRWIEV
ncbi:MAG: 5-formyltetrahydrofolate cyclo-ligase, partial [Verrucomicrobia bacterium]